VSPATSVEELNQSMAKALKIEIADFVQKDGCILSDIRILQKEEEIIALQSGETWPASSSSSPAQTTSVATVRHLLDLIHI